MHMISTHILTCMHVCMREVLYARAYVHMYVTSMYERTYICMIVYVGRYVGGSVEC